MQGYYNQSESWTKPAKLNLSYPPIDNTPLAATTWSTNGFFVGPNQYEMRHLEITDEDNRRFAYNIRLRERTYFVVIIFDATRVIHRAPQVPMDPSALSQPPQPVQE
jgi:hypothetical protein